LSLETSVVATVSTFRSDTLANPVRIEQQQQFVIVGGDSQELFSVATKFDDDQKPTAVLTLAALLALIDGQLELPGVLHSILEIITRLFLFFGSLITYFCIVGDDWIPSRDFLKYVLPISIVVNAFFGFLCGWTFHRFRTGKDPKK